MASESRQPKEQETDRIELADSTSGNALESEAVAVEYLVSVDLVIPFYVYYSVVASNHCASEVIKLDGPITHVDVTATWDVLLPQTLELTVYNGSRIRADPHTGYPSGDTLAQEEGPSPLTLDADVAADDTVRLQVCQWGNLAVVQDFDVQVKGSLHYLAPMSEEAA